MRRVVDSISAGASRCRAVPQVRRRQDGGAGRTQQEAAVAPTERGEEETGQREARRRSTALPPLHRGLTGWGEGGG